MEELNEKWKSRLSVTDAGRANVTQKIGFFFGQVIGVLIQAVIVSLLVLVIVAIWALISAIITTYF